MTCTDGTYLDANVVVSLGRRDVEKDGKQWEDRFLDEEQALGPHDHHRQNRHEDRH